MSENTSNPGPPAPDAPGSDAAQSAHAWYVGFLSSELAHRGQPEAAMYLEHHVQVRPEAAKPKPTKPPKPQPASAPAGEAGVEGQPVALALGTRMTEYSLRLNATSSEPVSWYIDLLAKEGDASSQPEGMLSLCTQAAKPPAGAVLVSSGYETITGRVVYRARWQHQRGELPVEGDFIEVMANGKFKKVFAMTRLWREPAPGSPARAL